MLACFVGTMILDAAILGQQCDSSSCSLLMMKRCITDKLPASFSGSAGRIHGPACRACSSKCKGARSCLVQAC